MSDLLNLTRKVKAYIQGGKGAGIMLTAKRNIKDSDKVEFENIYIPSDYVAGIKQSKDGRWKVMLDFAECEIIDKDKRKAEQEKAKKKADSPNAYDFLEAFKGEAP